MGHWGPGMQANDTAFDAIGLAQDMRKDNPAVSPADIFEWLRKRGFDVDGYLGVADWMLDNSEDLTTCQDLLHEAVRVELLPNKLESWRDPEEREAALRRFESRLAGDKIDEAAQKDGNRGLRDRLYELLEKRKGKL